MIEVPKIVGPVPDMIKQALDYIRTNVIKKRIIKPKDKAESISLDAIHKAEHLKSRRYRNRRLGDYLKELQLSEGRATGIPATQDELRKNGSEPARIETDEGRTYFLIEIPCIDGFEVTRIISKLSTDPLALIVRQGAKKDGGYILTEKGQAYLTTLI